MINLSEIIHYIPGLAPVDAVANTKYSDVINTKNAIDLDFIIQVGVVTGDDAVLTVEANSTAATGGTQQPFKVRESSAVGTDSMGAVESVTVAATGKTIGAGDDGKIFVVSINPTELTVDKPYVNICVDPGGSMSVFLISILVALRPRYSSETQPSHVI